MVTVEFLGPMARPSMQLHAQTLKEVAQVLNEDTTLKAWLESAAVAINDTLVSDINTKLQSGDKISLLPPVCGG